MARPVHIDDDRVLSAAREVFLKQGIKATTAEVAARAGISEGSLFNRWKTKGELFHAAIRTGRAGDMPEWVTRLDARVGKGVIERQLRAIGLDLLAFFRIIVPLSVVAWSEPSERQRMRREDGKPLPVLGIFALAAYFEAEMRLGRLDRREGTVVAQTFLGAVYHYAWVECTFGAERGELLPELDFMKGLIGLLLGGLAPKASKKLAAKARKTRSS